MSSNSPKKKQLRYEQVYKDRFSFGANWQKYLEVLTPMKMRQAKRSLAAFLNTRSLKGKTFLDIGCGSGLFSLCAIQLGARRVISVDVDENSIACAEYLRVKHNISPSRWIIKKGSALDRPFLRSLEKADIVYSWGVLHHTGDMTRALDNVATICRSGSLLYLAIYNDFTGFISSRTWVSIKKFYSGNGAVVRTTMKGIYLVYFTLGMLVHAKNPFSYIKNYPRLSVRGMDFFRDVEDWLGGYPYEYASVQEMESFFSQRSFSTVRIRPTAREGCNEFLFRKMMRQRTRS